MKKEKQGFEKSLKRLEEIVEKLEKGDIELDDSIKLYQEGIELSMFCSRKLEEAKGMIQMVVNSGRGYEKREFDAGENGVSGEPEGEDEKPGEFA